MRYLALLPVSLRVVIILLFVLAASAIVAVSGLSPGSQLGIAVVIAACAAITFRPRRPHHIGRAKHN
jgi:hypothetical protein